MGMTIEEAIKYYENKNVVLTEEEALANTLALNTMRKYQQLQADYENRLKADLKAILIELQLEIEELKSYESADGQDLAMLADIGILFQQKINALKAETEDQNGQTSN